MTKSSDPCEDPAVQAELDAILERTDSPVRYAVVFALTKRSNGFYDFSNGCWEWNCIPDVAIFKDREVADAAASALSEIMRKRAAESVIFGGDSQLLQVVALRKTTRGVCFLGEIKSRHATYVPVLPHLERPKASPAR